MYQPFLPFHENSHTNVRIIVFNLVSIIISKEHDNRATAPVVWTEEKISFVTSSSLFLNAAHLHLQIFCAG